MNRKSRACFCASSLCAICGLLMVAAGLAVLVTMAVDKKNAAMPDADLWIVLVMVMMSGLLLAMCGFICGNCSFCCFQRRSTKIADEEEEPISTETPVKGWTDD